MNSQVWYVSFISTLLGEVQATTDDSVIWAHDACELGYACYLTPETLEANCNLPTDIYYQLAGYASLNGLKFKEIIT